MLLLSVALTAGSFLILCPASAHAQGGVPLWTNRYDGPANGYDADKYVHQPSRRDESFHERHDQRATILPARDALGG
jgi:hypothetical protein